MAQRPRAGDISGFVIGALGIDSSFELPSFVLETEDCLTVDIPLVAPLRQTQPQPAVADVAAEVRKQWQDSRLSQRIQRGDRVLVGVGSRGIANLATMVRATLDVLRDLGTKPAIVAAMGSHGGATADGQRDLLASYGVSEERPARAGADRHGRPCSSARIAGASRSSGTRTPWRPTRWSRFRASSCTPISAAAYESGIVKMLVIGLGKRDGASQHHRWGVRGLREMMPETVKVMLEKTRFVAGLAVLENAREETARLQVVDRDELLDVEPRLLEEAKVLMGRLPFDQLDLLVIGEIGKNYSGRRHRPERGRPAADGRPAGAGVAADHPRSVPSICRRKATATAPACGIADLTTDRCSPPSTPCRSV